MEDAPGVDALGEIFDVYSSSVLPLVLKAATTSVHDVREAEVLSFLRGLPLPTASGMNRAT